MGKTLHQLEVERRQRFDERRQFLMKFPEVYQRDFDAALKKYLQRALPNVDPEDCDVLFNPVLREGFLTDWQEESRELSLTYHLVPIWDPDGDEPPEPVEDGAVRYIRCQDDRIWAKQITPDSILNLSPHKDLGRYLLVEIDLSKPRREIKASVVALVEQKRKHLTVSGSYRELVKINESRDREKSYTYEKMAVWQMVEQDRQTPEEDEKEILWLLAQAKTHETSDLTDGRKWRNEERRHYDALKSAYYRDKKIYFGD